MPEVLEMINELRSNIAAEKAKNDAMINAHGQKASSLETELGKASASLASSEEKLKAALEKYAGLEVEFAAKKAENDDLLKAKEALETEKSSSQAKIGEIEEKIKKALKSSELPATAPSATSDAAPVAAAPPGETNPDGTAKGGRRTLRRNGSKRRKNKRRKTTSRWRN
jgi:chromosome segregation ATPase